MPEAQVDWFTRDVEFPRAAFTYYYWFELDQHFMTHPHESMFTDFNTLLSSAREDLHYFNQQGQDVLNHILVVPLTFERSYRNRKSFWEYATKPNKRKLKTEYYLSLIPFLNQMNRNPDQVKAVVVCSGPDVANNNLDYFSCAGYFKPGKNHQGLIASIKRSPVPADQSVKQCAIYSAAPPFGYDFDTGKVMRKGEPVSHGSCIKE